MDSWTKTYFILTIDSVNQQCLHFIPPSFFQPANQTPLRCTMYSVFISVTQFRLAASVPSAVPAFK